MRQSGRYEDEIESFAASRKALRTTPTEDDPVTAAVGASSALLAVATRSVSDVLEVVSLPQYRTMAALASRPLLFSQLHVVLGVSEAKLDTALAALVEGGWAEQLGDETFSLTAHGIQLVTHVAGRREAELAGILATLPRADRRAVASAFTIFASAAETENPVSASDPGI